VVFCEGKEHLKTSVNPRLKIQPVGRTGLGKSCRGSEDLCARYAIGGKRLKFAEGGLKGQVADWSGMITLWLLKNLKKNVQRGNYKEGFQRRRKVKADGAEKKKKARGETVGQRGRSRKGEAYANAPYRQHHGRRATYATARKNQRAEEFLWKGGKFRILPK